MYLSTRSGISETDVIWMVKAGKLDGDEINGDRFVFQDETKLVSEHFLSNPAA